MLIIKKIFLDCILILFPITIYLIIINNLNYINEYKRNNIFSIMLIISLLLIINFNVNNKYISIFFSIPIIISYLKNNSHLSIILSFINIINCCNNYNEIGLIVLCKYIIYFLLYIENKNNHQKFIRNILIYQLLNILVIYLFNSKEYNIKYLLISLFSIYIYYFLLQTVLNILIKNDSLDDLLNKNIREKEFLFKLTHELKNPLAVCKGYIDIIEKNTTSRYIEIIKKEIERSFNIINEYSEYSKINIEKEEIDINLLVEEVYETFGYLINSKIKIIYQEYKDDLYIEADYNKLKEVLINLVKNSIEAIQEKGLIKLKVKLINNSIEILVEDNGMGMDEYTKENINKMFYTTKENGTGIGVAYSNEIIKLHKGELIYNSILNKGTIATIRLPLN